MSTHLETHLAFALAFLFIYILLHVSTHNAFRCVSVYMHHTLVSHVRYNKLVVADSFFFYVKDYLIFY